MKRVEISVVMDWVSEKIPSNPIERELFFHETDFRGQNFQDEDFSGENLTDRDFRRAILRNAQFVNCKLSGAIFADADISNANFRGANLSNVDFSNADLSNANFYKASLQGVKFIGSNLIATNFRDSTIGQTVFAGVEMETCTGLNTITHESPSSIAVECLYQFGSNPPIQFLRGIGFPKVFIEYLPSLIEASDTVQFHSCFISYSHEDEGFAHKLWSTMRGARIRVWYAPEEMQGGKKLLDQIDRAIQLHDKLVIILSKASICSSWVRTEIKRARQQEKRDGVRKIFPIRVCEWDRINSWECFDSDTGSDIAAELREYYISDFSNWLSNDKFDVEFRRLCRDLRLEGVQMSV